MIIENLIKILQSHLHWYQYVWNAILVSLGCESDESTNTWYIY